MRAGDTELRELLAAIEDADARAVSTAERALLAALDGSCRTPIGGYARLLPDGELHLTGLVARADGTFLLKRVAARPAPPTPRGSAPRWAPACAPTARATSLPDRVVPDPFARPGGA